GVCHTFDGIPSPERLNSRSGSLALLRDPSGSKRFSHISEDSMRRLLPITSVGWTSLSAAALLLMLFFTVAAAFAAGPPAEPSLIAKPEAFRTLVNPQCSHCVDEAKRRSSELRDDDRVLAWIRGYSDGGAIPYRFFLNPYRVISDTYGVFVYDPD